MAINIVLINPEIPPNTGNIARTCALTGARLHLVKPLGFDIDDKTVKRAGLDYWQLLDLTVHESVHGFFEYVEKENASLWFASTKGGTIYSEVNYDENAYIVFGCETSGLPGWIYETYAENLIRIPMLDIPSARSLNLSNAAAILLYEALRQNNFMELI